jgi:hypothetical protein
VVQPTLPTTRGPRASPAFDPIGATPSYHSSTADSSSSHTPTSNKNQLGKHGLPKRPDMQSRKSAGPPKAKLGGPGGKTFDDTVAAGEVQERRISLYTKKTKAEVAAVVRGKEVLVNLPRNSSTGPDSSRTALPVDVIIYPTDNGSQTAATQPGEVKLRKQPTSELIRGPDSGVAEVGKEFHVSYPL